jgi:hypothetical protein
VVDGGIVGPPPQRAGNTRLYLSGATGAVERVREVFAGTALEAIGLPGPAGRASALKLAFASYSKISHVLAAQACALAAGHDVLGELLELARDRLPHTPLGRPEQLAGAGARAWRWGPEMREIAEACAAAGVPDRIARAAADVFARWDAYKDDTRVPLDRLLAELRDD